jgi:hypothetical protein
MNATLGTPAQSLMFQVDTGSSDLWVNVATSDGCDAKGNPCAASGTYSANSSSTYKYISSDFNITYADGSGAAGDYVSDTLTIGSTNLASQQFGVGYSSSSTHGVVGVGYESDEAGVGRAPAYNNLPAQMVADGLIQSNAYSLWLNDLDASTGNILFGGVDTDQYTGSLETLPVQKLDGEFIQFLITLTELTLGTDVIAENQALAVLLDSGTSLTYLPNSMVSAIYELVDAEFDSSTGEAFVPCSLASNTSTLNFTFSNPTISIPMSELVLEPVSTTAGQKRALSGNDACLFGIAPGGDSTPTLGDTFLRSAYVVYDLANNEISIAQTDFNSTSTNVMEIASGASGVPDATLVSNAASASGGSDAGGSIGGTVTGFASSPTSKSAAQKTAPPVQFGAMALMGAGVLYAAM